MAIYNPLDITSVHRETGVVLSLLLEQQPKKILEVGCGTGYLSIELAKHGWDVTGTDINPKAIEVSKRNAERAGASVAFVESDLFENVRGRFDIIAFDPPLVFSSNPFYPYARGVVARIPLLNTALVWFLSYLPNTRHSELIERFFDDVKGHLTNDGRVYFTILARQLPALRKHFKDFKAVEAGPLCRTLIIARKHL